MLHDGWIRADAKVQSYLWEHVKRVRTLHCILLVAMKGRICNTTPAMLPTHKLSLYTQACMLAESYQQIS